ncbi:MAG: stalk domain-containing protein, partial [Candidatus Omnitrophica bacterium]|nr:stalk domain-containing protein [Candidatus Omnitrophota bacterium]
MRCPSSIVFFLVAGALIIEIFPAVALDTSDQEWVIAQKKEQTGFDLSGYVPDPALSILFEEKSFTTAIPPERRGDDIWVPLDGTVQGLGLVLIVINDLTVNIIGFDGSLMTLRVGKETLTIDNTTEQPLAKPLAKKAGRFMIQIEVLARSLGLSYEYRAEKNQAVLNRPGEEEFSAFTLEKPPEVIAKEHEAAQIEKLQEPPTLPRDIAEEQLSSRYRRDIELQVDSSFEYLKDMFTEDINPRTRYNRY